MTPRPHCTALLLAAVAAPAQNQDPEQLQHLAAAIHTASQRVAASIVTVETFGGMRKKLAPSGNRVDGELPSSQPSSQPSRPTSRPGSRPGSRPQSRPGSRPNQPPKMQMEGFLQAQGATTGIVLTSDGWIVVSRFALNFDPTTILVTLANGDAYEAERAGEDKSRGIALLKIDAEGLSVPDFADPKTVRVGQWAAALGRTFGRHEPSVHLGIVSAVDRQLGRAIQTDASTSPANYGGPLVDLDGRVLGIVVPLSLQGEDAGVELYDSGIGFAASLFGIEPLLARMQNGEELHRGWLGVMARAEHLGPGAIVQQLVPKSPAAGAGLKVGDTIEEVDGETVRHNSHLQMLIGRRMAGDPLALRIRRGDETFGITVFLARPDAK